MSISMPSYTGSESITAENHARTKDHATTRKTLASFNNCSVVGRDSRGFLVECTKTVAETVARDFAMNVTHVDGSMYTVARRYPYHVIGSTIDA